MKSPMALSTRMWTLRRWPKNYRFSDLGRASRLEIGHIRTARLVMMVRRWCAHFIQGALFLRQIRCTIVDACNSALMAAAPVCRPHLEVFLDPRSERSITGALRFRLEHRVPYMSALQYRVSLTTMTRCGDLARLFLGGGSSDI